MQKSLKKKGKYISIRIAAALLPLTLLSLFLTAGLFARYTAEGKSNDHAHVASFSVEPGGTYFTPEIIFDDMIPGDARTYSFNFTSESEVAVECTAVLTSTSNLPLLFWLNGTPVEPDGEHSVTLFSLAPGAAPGVVTLTAEWPESLNSLTYLGEIDSVRLTVTATQID